MQLFISFYESPGLWKTLLCMYPLRCSLSSSSGALFRGVHFGAVIINVEASGFVLDQRTVFEEPHRFYILLMESVSTAVIPK